MTPPPTLEPQRPLPGRRPPKAPAAGAGTGAATGAGAAAGTVAGGPAGTGLGAVAGLLVGLLAKPVIKGVIVVVFFLVMVFSSIPSMFFEEPVDMADNTGPETVYQQFIAIIRIGGIQLGEELFQLPKPQKRRKP